MCVTLFRDTGRRIQAATLRIVPTEIQGRLGKFHALRRCGHAIHEDEKILLRINEGAGCQPKE